MPTQNEQVVSHEYEDDVIEALNAYWTKDAMAGAIPIEQQMDGDGTQPLGAPYQLLDSAAETLVESRAADGAGDPTGADLVSPAAFRTARVGKLSDFPYATVGKLFMVFGGQNYVGSAWVVAEKAVYTAGHCVYDGAAGWADRLLFVPQYDNGSEPLGRWAATRVHSLKGWVDQGADKFQFDMGVFVTDRVIRPSTGSLGWVANASPNQGPYDAIGYPASAVAGYAFDGQRMWHSLGDYVSGTNPIRMDNNMTGGCSGGPWSITRSSKFYANGLNSFRYTSQPNALYSPYFGDGFINLYDAVKNEV